MEHSILKLKAWQVFLILLASYFISSFVRDEVMSDMLKLLVFCSFCIWLALLGNTLNQLSKTNEKPGLSWFVVNIVLTMAAPVISEILAGPNFVITPTSFNAKGIWAIPTF